MLPKMSWACAGFCGVALWAATANMVIGAPTQAAAAPAAHAEAPAAANHVEAPAAAAPAARPAETPHTVSSANSAGAAQSAQVRSAASANQVRSSNADQRSNSVTNNATGNNGSGRNNNNLNNSSTNGYYLLGSAYNYWNPGWNGYNNSNGQNYNNGPAYPGQFNQQDTAVAEPDSSADRSLNSQTLPAVTPAPVPVVADTASPVLNSALMASPQWRDADAQVRVAQSEYDSASALVMAQLQTQPAYQQAIAQKTTDAQKVDTLKARDPGAPIDKTEAVATAKLNAAQSVTQLQNSALANDPRASAAKAKLDTAIAEREEARRAIEATIPKTVPPLPAR